MQKFIFIGFLSLFFACKGVDKSDNKVEKIAKVYCECTSDLVVLNQKMIHALNDTSLHVDFQQFQTENTKSNECLAAVVAKYGKLNANEITQVKTLLKMQCPELSKLNPAQLDNQLKETLGE
jgi:cyanate lyase